MESHLISKQVGSLILRTIFFAFVAISLYSCKDSLGYDPNVQITEVVKDTTIKPPDGNNPTQFTVDSVRAVFSESYRHNGMNFEIPWNYRILTKKVTMDTSTTKKVIWIEMSAESKNDNDYRGMNRMDRIIGFELNFSAIIDYRKFYMDGSKERNRWFKIIMKKTMNDATEEFFAPKLKASIVIMDYDRFNGSVRLLLESELPFNTSYHTRKFHGIIDVYIKK